MKKWSLVILSLPHVLVDLPMISFGGDILIQTQRILLLGVEDTTAAHLMKAISPLKRNVQVIRDRSIEKCIAAIEHLRPHIMCVPPDTRFYLALTRALHSRGLELPFVVVSGRSRPIEWRSALEGGAADYCSAPFEASRVDQVLGGAAARPMTAFFSLEPASPKSLSAS